MSNPKPKFIQLHVLTSYPPSNPNRDDLGQPKSAWMGGTQRLRISSQSLKRAWRTSDTFKTGLLAEGESKEAELSNEFGEVLQKSGIQPHPYIGVRTKNIGIAVKDALEQRGVDKKKAQAWAEKIAFTFGDKKKKNNPNGLKAEQLFLFSTADLKEIDKLIETLANDGKEPTEKQLSDLISVFRSVDIALFGRMLAKSGANFRDDGSVQVAHALSVHEVQIEDDYFTAVDDLNKLDEEAGEGAGFLDSAQFGASLHYQYVCIDRDLLERNLTPEAENAKDAESVNGDEASRPNPEDLTRRTVKALIEAMVKVTPSGKRAPFGHHTYAHYVLAERGDQQPRGLHVAFLQAVSGKRNDWLATSREALKETCEKMDAVYGACAEKKRYQLDFANLEGTLDELKAFVADGGAGNWTPRSADKLKAAAKKDGGADA